MKKKKNNKLVSTGLELNQDELASLHQRIYGIEPSLPALFVTELPIQSPLKIF